MSQLEMIPGSTRDTGLSQFFTPPKLAQKLVQWAGVCRGGNFDEPYRVLEPSAGNGAVVRPLVAAGAEVTAVELDTRYFGELVALNPRRIIACSFLELRPDDAMRVGPFDLCVVNFPFHIDLKGEFTLHALEFAPRVVAIYPGNVFYSEQREDFWKRVRPTRIAYMSKRAWPGATDYVALELVKRVLAQPSCPVTVEWWHEAWT